jgi:hypothetical protein
MKIETCTDTEIRISFRVGEDKSRTWIITLDEKGLLFNHDLTTRADFLFQLTERFT